MKALKIALFTLFVIMLSIITFYSFSLIFTVVANHEALDLVSLSGIPMIMLMCALIACLAAGYRYVVRKQQDSYLVRQFAILVAFFSLVGLVFSILCGTIIYGSFVKDYIFKCYPLLMLILHTVLLGTSVYVIVNCQISLKKGEEEMTKFPFAYQLRSFGIGVLLLFALNRLGAFVLIPYYWSDYDSVYTLPYLFQLLVPSVVLITYLLHEDFLRNRKVTLILSGSCLAYSLFSMIYMICMSKGNYPLTLNSLTAIQLFERLVKYPIDAWILYGVSFLIPFLNGLNNTVMIIKERKAKQGE